MHNEPVGRKRSGKFKAQEVKAAATPDDHNDAYCL